MNLTNPVPKSATSPNARIIFQPDVTAFNYFFHGALSGEWGSRAALFNTFFIRFHAECLAAGIPNHFEPDNEHRIATILDRLNFSDPAERIRILESDRDFDHKRIADLERELDQLRVTNGLAAGGPSANPASSPRPSSSDKPSPSRKHAKGRNPKAGSKPPKDGAVASNNGSGA